MGARQGTLSRLLSISSTLATVYLAGLVLISHPLGFLGAIIILWLGSLVVDAVRFISESEYLLVSGGEGAPKPRPLEEEEEASVETRAARMVAVVEAVAQRRAPGPSRILGPPPSLGPLEPRVLGQPKTEGNPRPKTVPAAEGHKEDAEWAEMFRAL